MATTEVKVPDIGNYTNIPVIEVLVKPGDTVTKDQGLVTLESDKATMEVPSSVAGVVKEVKVKAGDQVSEGSIVALIEAQATDAPKLAPAKSAEPAKPTTSATTHQGGNTGTESRVKLGPQGRYRMPGLSYSVPVPAVTRPLSAPRISARTRC